MSLALQIKDRPEYKSKAPALAFTTDDKVIDACKVMAEKNYGSCVIIDKDQKPIGIFTERDLLKRVAAEGKDPASTKLGDVMSTDLKLAKPEDRVIDWLRQMSNERFRRVPVVDENGKLVNIMSQGDFVSYTWPELHLGKNFRGAYIAIAVALYSIIMYGAVKYIN